MSEDKTQDQLFRAAAGLPTELSLNEVEFLFLNQAPPPPARPWWRKGYLKFLLMFTLLVALLGFLLPTQTDGTPPQLSAFLVQEQTLPISPIEALPSINQLVALDRPAIEIIPPEVRLLAPKARIAPAAAPKKIPAQTKTPDLSPAPSSQNPSSTREVTLPIPLFTGSWKQWKRSSNFVDLFFNITEDNSRQVDGSVAALTEAELQTLKDESEVTIERASGSLILSGGKRKGSFEFIPNASFRDRLIGTLGTSIALFTDSLTRIYSVPLVNDELPDNWGTGIPSRTGIPLDVTACSKLVVKGNVRLYLNYSDAPREIVVFASPAARLALNVKQSGDRLKLTNTHPTELIDIQVSGPLLESIRTAGNALFFNKAKKVE